MCRYVLPAAGAAAHILADSVLQQASGAGLGAAEEGQEDGSEECVGQESKEARGILLRLLRSLDLRFPAALDDAVAAALPAVVGSDVNSAVNARGTGGQQQIMQAGYSNRRRPVLALLSEAFVGTARGHLAEAGTTVLLAAEAPSAAVRQMVSPPCLNHSPRMACRMPLFCQHLQIFSEDLR
jgi:hypothetical protein